MSDDKRKKNNKKVLKRKFARKAELNIHDIPASKRKMKYFKRKRTQNRIKKTINRTHLLLKILSTLFLLWFASKLIVCSYWYLPQNAFDNYPNKHLKITGNTITPNDRILDAIRVIPIEKKPIYLMKTAPYESEIEKLSPVKKAFVRRYWLPTRFEITIEEEIPVFTIAPNSTSPEIAAITVDGKVIEKLYLPLNSNRYQTYKILTYDDFQKWTKNEILPLNVLCQRIEDFSGEKLLYLDIRNQKDAYAQLETIKIRIGELNSTLKQRIERLSSIMPQIEYLKDETDYVDLRWDNTTYLKKKAKETHPIMQNNSYQIGAQKKKEENKVVKKAPVLPQNTTVKVKNNKVEESETLPPSPPIPPIKLDNNTVVPE